LAALKIESVWWAFDQPVHDSTVYLPWIKKQLMEKIGVIMFVMCKGDAHNSYGLGTFDHIEPIFGIYSNGSYNVTAVGDDDWIVHGSDYSPDGDMNKGYFRQLNKMTDDTTMTGNCANA
jgi:hypothetical protein